MVPLYTGFIVASFSSPADCVELYIVANPKRQVLSQQGPYNFVIWTVTSN